ncbi:hypothetical protein Ddc_16784 [Ditylenchus destructor]|nr:hypothetical protein Ddc_16784 [Ditylenchus destructor]
MGTSDSETIHAATIQDSEISSTDGESWKLVDDSSDDDESTDNGIVKWGSQLDMGAGEFENSSAESNSEKDSCVFVEQDHELLSPTSIEDAEVVFNVTANSAELPSTSASFPLVIRNNSASRKLDKNNVHKKNGEMKNSTCALKTRAFLNCRISSTQGATPDSNLHRRNNSPKLGNSKIVPPTAVELETRQEFMDKVKKALLSDTTCAEVKCIANVPPTVTQANTQIQAIKSNQMNGAVKTADRFNGTSSQKLPTLFNSNRYWVENHPKTSNTSSLTANKQELVTREEFAAMVKKALSDNGETSVKIAKLEALKEEQPSSALTMKVRQDLKDFVEMAVQNDASLLQKQSDSKVLDTHNVRMSVDSVLTNSKSGNPNTVVKRPYVKCDSGNICLARDKGNGKRCQSGKWYEPFSSEFQHTKNSSNMSQTYSASNEPFLNLGVPNPQDAAASSLANIMRYLNGDSDSFHTQRTSTTDLPSFGETLNPQEAGTTMFVNILNEVDQNSNPVNSGPNNVELEENTLANGNVLDAIPPSNYESEDRDSESDAEELDTIANEPEDRMIENENLVDDVGENDAFFGSRYFTNCLLLLILIFNFGWFTNDYISLEEESNTLQSSISELQSEISRLRYKNFVTTRHLSSMIERFNIPTGSDTDSIAAPPETFFAKFLLILSTIYVHLDHLFTALVNQFSKYGSWEQFLLYFTCFGGILVMYYLVTRFFSLVRKLFGYFVR